MMRDSNQRLLRVPYTQRQDTLGNIGDAPLLSLTLTSRGTPVSVSGLVDSGASVNVLPYSIGKALGAEWDEQKLSLNLEGNLAGFEARPLLVSAQVADLEPVRLVFAWSLADNIPVILGQVNFFQRFNVCFFRSEGAFEIRPI